MYDSLTDNSIIFSFLVVSKLLNYAVGAYKGFCMKYFDTKSGVISDMYGLQLRCKDGNFGL